MSVQIIFAASEDLTPYGFTDTVGAQLAADIQNWVDQDVGPAYGQGWSGHYSIIYVPHGKPVPLPAPRVWIFTLVGNSTVAGALGWHSADPSGHIYGEIAVGTSLESNTPVSIVASHEVVETLVNRWVDSYKLTSHNGQVALGQCEAGDPVERFSYTFRHGSRSVLVTDYCLESYWHSAGAAPFSKAGHAPGPFTPAPGGRQQFLGITGALAASPGDKHVCKAG